MFVFSYTYAKHPKYNAPRPAPRYAPRARFSPCWHLHTSLGPGKGVQDCAPCAHTLSGNC